MPTYQYRCTECGHDLEAVQKFTDTALTECPSCGGPLRKIYNAVGVVFKGSGFYRTDSRKADRAGEGGGSSSESGDGGNGSKDGGSGSKDGSNGSGSGSGEKSAPKTEGAAAKASSSTPAAGSSSSSSTGTKAAS